jgi:hypothetical protein
MPRILNRQERMLPTKNKMLSYSRRNSSSSTTTASTSSSWSRCSRSSDSSQQHDDCDDDISNNNNSKTVVMMMQRPGTSNLRMMATSKSSNDGLLSLNSALATPTAVFSDDASQSCHAIEPATASQRHVRQPSDDWGHYVDFPSPCSSNYEDRKLFFNDEEEEDNQPQ